MPNNSYATRLSGAISWLRFPLIVFIILLHCYSVAALPGQHNLYFSLIYPLSLWLGETGVPMLSALAAYALFRVVWCQTLLPYWHDMAVIYTAYDVSFVISMLILVPAYRRAFRRAARPEPQGATIAAL